MNDSKNKLEQIKKDLVSQIKELSLDISKSETFIGLLSNELKFRSLHEKFLALKFLEERRLGLDIFDEPIPVSTEKEEIFSSGSERFDDEKPNEVIFEYKNEPKSNKIVLEVEEEVSQKEIKKSEGESLPKIQIDFNDKLGFIHQLFNGDEADYKRAIDSLHNKTNLEDSILFIDKLKERLNQQESAEYIDRLKELVKKRFE